MATATKTKSLEVTCPHCMSTDDTVRLDLNDLTEITCAGCDATFSAAEAAEMFSKMAERWQAVARWVESAPTV